MSEVTDRERCPCDRQPDGDYPDVACDAPTYPPREVAVCQRHGVDPCHDDAAHLLGEATS
jgi:hypothetical protein